MKYALLNCWTDQNKGDLGIMIATIQEIKKQDSEAKFIAVSSYGAQDPYFYTCHNLLKKYVDVVYPAIFGVLIAKIGNKTYKNVIFKSMVGFWDFTRLFISDFFPIQYAPHFFSAAEWETLINVQKCDLLIAKGGSVFLNNGTLRSKISLLRLCAFYKLLEKMNCRYLILGQSFGPITGRICKKNFIDVVKNSERTYLRERKCLKKYNDIKLSNFNIGFSNDIAFLLSQEKIDFQLFGNDIGMTIRMIGNEYDHENVIKYFEQLIEYLVNEQKFHVHLFLQVSDPNEPDVTFTNEVFDKLLPKIKEAVTYHVDEYTPQQLKYIYGKMRIFIGTRLHSTIFSLGAGVPTICLIYQGTKAQGIFSELDLEELVVRTTNLQEIISKIEDILKQENFYRKKISENTMLAKEQARKAITETISIAGNLN